MRTSQDFFKVLSNGFNKSETYTTEPSTEKTQVILIDIPPLSGNITLPEVNLQFASSAHHFAFKPKEITCKPFTSSHISTDITTKLNHTKLNRVPKLSTPIPVFEFETLTSRNETKFLEFNYLSGIRLNQDPPSKKNIQKKPKEIKKRKNHKKPKRKNHKKPTQQHHF